HTVALSIILVAPYSPLAAQTPRRSSGSVAIKSKPVLAEPLVEILNYGPVRDLNSENDRDQELRLPLYEVPQEGDCVPNTTVVCSHHYYLAVSTFEEGLGESQQFSIRNLRNAVNLVNAKELRPTPTIADI